MKFGMKSIMLISLSTLAFSEVTICFKKNHNDISTIESIKLDGGICSGTKSQQDMKKEGWKFENLQVKDDGYLFIFKKDDKNINSNDVKSLKSTIIAEIKTEKEKEEKISKAKNKIAKLEKGKNLYLKKCSSCHGLKGEKMITNSSSLNSMKLDDIQSSIKGYKIGSYNLGNASEMRPYSVGITSTDIKSIYAYIQNVNVVK